MQSPLLVNISSMNVTISVMIDDSNVSNADQFHGTRTFHGLNFRGPLSQSPWKLPSITFPPRRIFL
jgi:hypothetical protein